MSHLTKKPPAKIIPKRQQIRLERKHRQEAILGRIALLVLVSVALLIGYLALNGAFHQPHPILENEILGTWVNTDGYQIQFRSGGVGFIPGVTGEIPDYNFVYSIIDDSHIKIDLQGQSQTIGIQIINDQLTWSDSLGEVIYQRVK